MAIISDKKGVQQLVESFIYHGVQNIIFSPGSRNAPLVVSFANVERFNCYVIPDERSAAFFALGMAEQTKFPTAVMCTSGSALLNHYPAVSEAFYRNIPLIVVSADRPKEWIDQGDGQTIRQENVLQNHVYGYAELIESPLNEDQEWHNRRMLDEVMIKSKSPAGGPIHINFPFKEPLYNTVDSTEQNNNRNFDLLQLEQHLSSSQVNELKEIWNQSEKILVLCGQMDKNPYLNEQLKNLATNKSVAVVVENTSNLQDRSFVHCIDRTITSFLDSQPELYQPDILITIGGSVISKKVKSYLRKYKPKHHWKIGEQFPFMDTYQSMTLSIPMNVNSFFNILLEDGFNRDMSRYGEQWRQLNYLAKGEHENYLESCRYSDLSVIDFILDAVPDSSNLHIANSSVIRYAQLFDPIKSIHYYCNRGTSGIDGTMSTALGITVASGKEKVNTIIVGDMSFFYDSNAFWNHYLPTNLRIFLINNGGGGIFNIIPGPKSTPNNSKYFVTEHSFSAKYICEAFDVNYYAATSLEEIDQQIDEFYDVLPNERPALMEIFTDNTEGSLVLQEYFEAIKVEEIPVLKL